MKYCIFFGVFMTLVACATSNPEPNQENTRPTKTDYVYTSTLQAKATLVGIGASIGIVDGAACALFDRSILQAFPVPLSWIFSKQLREEIVNIVLKSVRLPVTVNTAETVTSITFAQSCSWISYLLCMAYYNTSGRIYIPKKIQPPPQSKWKQATSLIRWIKKNHTFFKKRDTI